jgi:hypothetical protein
MPTRGLFFKKQKFNFEVKHTMKTFNKTLIAAATLTAFGLAAAPAAVALDASASLATSYLFRGAEMNSGSAVVNADVSGEMSGIAYGLFVSSGDVTTEHDFYASYSGTASGIGYTVGYADYNYADETADFEETFVSLSYGPASVTVFNEQDSDDEYTVIGYEAGAYSFAYGDDDTSTHFDVSYSVNDSLTLTLSEPEDADTIVVASYSLPF